MTLERSKWFGGLKKHPEQKTPSDRSEESLTDDQQREWVVRSADLLKALIEIASPFMVNDVLDLGRWEISSVTYFTPPIPISDKVHVNAELYHRVRVDRANDQLGLENVTAELSIQASEDQISAPVIILEGIRDKTGEITRTEVGLSDLTQEEAAEDRFTRIKNIQKTVDAIGEYFVANPDLAKNHRRHVTTVKDLSQATVIQIPQK